MLQRINSAADLMLRGYSREMIKSMIGEDIGYNGASLKKYAAGIDRFQYKVDHVRQRVISTRITEILDAYAEGATKTQTLNELGLHGENIVKLKDLFAALGYQDEFKAADTAQRRGSMSRGMKSKYGVDNPFKAEEFQQAAAATRQQRYGAKYTLAAGSTLEASARQKFRDQLQDPEYAEDLRERRAATNLKRYGVRVPAQSPVIRAKGTQTTRERYGVDHFMRTSQAREEQSQRALLHGKEWAKKAQQTMLDRYGVVSYNQLPAMRAQRSVDMQMSFDERNAKARATHRRRYGVEYPTQRPEYRNGLKEWRDENPREFSDKSRRTMLSNYGVEHYNQLPERRQSQSRRMLDPRYQMRVIEKKRRSGTFNSSKPETDLHDLLIEHFGAADVLTQHREDPRYPFACDFYIPSRDLFIELNGLWTHGGHWFDEDSEVDRLTVATWAAKDTAFYDAAIKQWVQRDVEKRDQAAAQQLNYVVFWDSKSLDDAQLWLALGAPDGIDWRQEYSWLPRRELVVEAEFPQMPTSGAGATIARRAAKAATGETFYAAELQLWKENPGTKSGTVQSRLYANRYRYLNKLPHQLSDSEILRGLRIMGQVRGYTTFDNTGMKQVIADYPVSRIYDPCAGWGERMFTAASLGLGYIGTDISAEVVAGHQRMIAHYGLDAQSIHLGDAAAADMRQGAHDTVFTCPPYGDVEIYTEDGAENLSDEGFLQWWAQVVELSVAEPTTVFAYQINQRWKSAMNEVLVSAGWHLVQQIPVGAHRVSHLNRRGGASKRREFEEIQVFTRGSLSEEDEE